MAAGLQQDGVDLKDIKLVCHTRIIKSKRTRLAGLSSLAMGLNFKHKLVLGCVWFLRPAWAFPFQHTVFSQMEDAMNVQVYTQPG